MSNISTKNFEEIKKMRHGGRILATILDNVAAAVRPGITPRELSQLTAKLTEQHDVEAAFMGYQGFPDPICISVNEAVVHGIPGTIPIRDGDVVGLDYGVRSSGMVTDGATTVVAGTASVPVQRLLSVTQEALAAGIAMATEGNRVGDISAAVEKVLRRGELGIIRDLVGHGVGHELWEEPQIPNYGKAHRGPMLHAGMTLAIEPMATLGGSDIVLEADGWTISTADRSLAAQFEHTVLVTTGKPEILTHV